MKSNSSYEPRAMAGGIEGEAKRLEAQSALAWDAEYNELRQAGIEEASTVLEVGCGTGSFLKRLCEALPSTSIIGIEPDPELFEIAGKALADQQHRAQLHCCPFQELNNCGIRADFVVARMVFQHLSDPAEAARRIGESIEPGGTLAIIDVDGSLWGAASPLFPELSSIHEKVWRSQAAKGGDRFIGHRLARILRSAGYSSVTTRLALADSDEVGIADFLVVMDPSLLAPLVAEEIITLSEYSKLLSGFDKYRNDPEAHVLNLSFVVTGVKL